MSDSIIQMQRGEKRPRETTQGLLGPPSHHQPDINFTVATSSSRFQWKLGGRDVPVTRPERPKSYPNSIHDHNVVGIEEDVQELVQRLIDPQSGNFLAIVGMGGSGKTTLARKIYNHEDIRRHFDCRTWACVSQVWSEKSLLEQIYFQTTHRANNNLTVPMMLAEIHTLLEGKSYLGVLDDVWESDALTKIMIPTARSHGSKFIITTRKKNIIQFYDLVFSIYEPRRLNNDLSFELFKKIAFDHQSNTSMTHTNDHIVDLAKKMLKKCEGLPLAVISLAGLLRTKKTIQEWMIVSNNVASKIIEDYRGLSEYGRVKDILGLSYSDMDYTLKSCFMYLSLFPEDYEIPCGMLMRCWIAEGFFKSVWLSANETIEDLARQYLEELIQRCLVQIVEVNYLDIVHSIRVHDLLRDLGIKKARAKCFCDTFTSSSSPISTMRFLRLSINTTHFSDGEELLEYLGILLDLDLSPTQNHFKVSRRLRSFMLFNTDFRRGFHVKTLFTNYPLLRVLILYDLDDGIPDGIGSLIHLRYLRLSFDSRDIHLPDSLQNLRNLLSFDIRNGDKDDDVDKIVKVPNVKQMKQLRYLRLPWAWNDYKESSLNLHHLRNLKVLWGIPSGKWVMTELKHLSTSIEKLGINVTDKSEELEEVYQCPSILQDNLYSLRLCIWNVNNAGFKLQKLQHCNKLQKLYLDGKIAATGVPYVFPPYLVKLQLTWSRLDDHDSFADAFKRLTYLKVLILTYNAYVGVDLTFPANSLLYLERLELDTLAELKRIRVMEGAMPHLETFHCLFNDNLKVLWGIPSGKWMMMRRLKYELGDIVKLGIIDIKNSEGLDLLYQFPKKNLCTLKLKLKTCDTKFELQKLQHFRKLKKLYLGGVIAATNVPFVFPSNLLLLKLERSGLGDRDSFADALQTLTFLKVLKLAHSAYVGVDLTFPSNSLLNLEKLQLYHLTNLERIHVMEGAMPNLKSLEVGHCKKLEVIPQCLWHLVIRVDDDEEEDEDMFVSDEDEDDVFVSDEDEDDVFVSDEDEDDMFVSDEDEVEIV